MHRIDGEGATVDNKFTEGNPSTGAIATAVTADWLNALQEEIIAVLSAAGIEPIKATNTQLRDAIVSLISGGGVAVSADGVSIADTGGFFSGANVELALQQLAERLYTGTINASQIRRTVILLLGTAYQTDVAHAENFLSMSNVAAITYTIQPDSALDLPIGTAIEIAQNGAGKVTVVPGAGVTLLKGASFNAATMETHAIITLIKTSPDVWRLGGMLEAA